MKQLHPGAKWQFRIGMYITMLFLLFFVAWFIAPIFLFLGVFLSGGSEGAIVGILIGIMLFGFFYIVLSILIAEIYARMSYNRWFYDFTKDGIKFERGIIWKRYSNVPYERIQNVDVRRGILARMLGYSSVMIQTAGYSQGPYSEGYLPAVDMDEAEEIRSSLMKKISKRK